MSGRIDPSPHAGPAVGHRLPIARPEPWWHDGYVLWPHWDLWFCAVALQRRAELRGAVYRGDGQAVVEALRGRPLEAALQLAGDGPLSALAQGTPGASEVATRCASLLRERSNWGDEEIADQLEAAIGTRPAPLLRAVPVNLEELSMMLEGDPAYGGGRLDLETGETWPAGADDLWREEFAEEEDLEDEEVGGDETLKPAGEEGQGQEPQAEGPRRCLWVECLGSRDGYRDMEDFIGAVSSPRRREMLEAGIAGRGAFRRFRDVLARWPEEDERWYLFSDDRRRGRARAWLTGEGYRPAVRGTGSCVKTGSAAPPQRGPGDTDERGGRPPAPRPS